MSHECQSILHAPNGRLLCQMASVCADLADGHVIPEHSHPEDQLLFASSGVMNVSPLLRELILHACKFKRLNKRATGERRIIEIIVDQLKGVDSVPLQLPHPT